MKTSNRLLIFLIFIASMMSIYACSSAGTVEQTHSYSLKSVTETKYDDLKHVDISDDGQYFLMAGNYGPVKIFKNGILNKPVFEKNTKDFSQVISAHFIDKSDAVFIASRSGDVSINQLIHGTDSRSFHFDAISGLAAISSNQEYISIDGLVFDTKNNVLLKNESAIAVQSAVQFIGNDLLMVASVHNNQVSIRYLDDNLLYTFEFDDKVFNAAIDDNKRFLVVSLRNGDLILTDLNSRKRIASLKRSDTATGIAFFQDKAYVTQGHYLDIIDLPEFKLVDSMSLDGNIQVLDLVQGKLVIGTFTGQVSLLSLSEKSTVDVVAQYQFGEPVEDIHFNARTHQLIVAGRHGKFGLYKVSSSND